MAKPKPSAIYQQLISNPPAGSHPICNNYFFYMPHFLQIGVNVYYSFYRIMGIIHSICRTGFLNKVWNFLMFPKVLDPGLVLFSRNVIIGAMGSLTDSSKPFKLSFLRIDAVHRGWRLFCLFFVFYKPLGVPLSVLVF